jgi:hypothetical protein
MPGLLLPLISWGAGTSSSLSLSAITRTNGQTDIFGGTEASLMDDVTVGSESYTSRAFAPVNSGVQMVHYLIKGGTAAQTILRTWNQSQVTDNFRATATWTAGVPAVVANIGLLVGVISLGGGWYLVLGLSTSAPVAGNNCLWLINPTGLSNPATGTIYVDERPVVLLDYLDEDKAWDNPPPGSVRVRAPSGVVDRWILGGRRDYRFKAVARWIPSVARGVPQIVSGWDGLNEVAGVNCGVRAMLEAGSEGFDLRFVPDRSLCTKYITSDLVEPFDEETYDFENNVGDRKVAFELVNTTTVYPTVL